MSSEPVDQPTFIPDTPARRRSRVAATLADAARAGSLATAQGRARAGAGAAARVARRHLPTPVVRRVEAQVASRRGGSGHAADAPADASWAPTRPEPPLTGTRLLIAPANFAGQGHAWARAVDAHVPGVGARNAAVAGPIAFPADQRIARAEYRDIAWQRAQRHWVESNFTHVLIEAQRPLFGTLYDRTCAGELPRLRRAGLDIAFISHGSDLRVPSEHARRHPHSPFAERSAAPAGALVDPRTRATLERTARRNRELLGRVDGPVYVSTPDLLDDAPQATWCPTVVDPQAWAADAPVLQRPVPRIVHIPSHGPLKGSAYIDAALADLAAAGRIEYRRLQGLDRAGLVHEYETADIVIDQVAMGLYGVAAVEAMAAGRLVLAEVTDTVRERIRRDTGQETPIVEVTATTLAAVVTQILDDRDAFIARAAAGPDYVRAVHDGRHSAAVLGRWLHSRRS